MTEEKASPTSRPMDEEHSSESGGGPYPNPHDAKDEARGDFKGGQSNQAYYGPGQLGEHELGEDAEPNAPSDER